jgi:hypothetical protein
LTDIWLRPPDLRENDPKAVALPQKSVCMSITISAVFADARLPSKGLGYGSAATVQLIIGGSPLNKK